MFSSLFVLLRFEVVLFALTPWIRFEVRLEAGGFVMSFFGDGEFFLGCAHNGCTGAFLRPPLNKYQRDGSTSSLFTENPAAGAAKERTHFTARLSKPGIFCLGRFM
mgnify:CR=1 FL=1